MVSPEDGSILIELHDHRIIYPINMELIERKALEGEVSITKYAEEINFRKPFIA